MPQAGNAAVTVGSRGTQVRPPCLLSSPPPLLPGPQRMQAPRHLLSSVTLDTYKTFEHFQNILLLFSLSHACTHCSSMPLSLPNRADGLDLFSPFSCFGSFEDAVV